VLVEGVQSAVVLERNHAPIGEPLRMRIASVASASAKEELGVVVRSGEGVAVGGQSVSIALEPGLSVHEAMLDTGELASDGYTIRWRSRISGEFGRAGVTLLPPFNVGAVEEWSGRSTAQKGGSVAGAS
jgi:hypothetical protein